MSLAGQISPTVTALAATAEARREALARIRAGAASHLSEARATHRRMATAQQHHLTQTLRSMKLGTAILLGAADERIDGYRKARIKQAARIDRELAEGLKALRGNTRKWIGTQSAVRRKATAEDLRQRRRDRKALTATVRELTARNIAFLAGLTRDRQEASVIWLGRRAAAAPAPHSGAAHAKAHAGSHDAPAAAAKAEAAPAKTEPTKFESAKSEPAKSEPAKFEPAKFEPAKFEPTKFEATVATAAKPTVKAEAESKPVAEAKSAADARSSGQKPAAERPGPGKPM